MPIANPDDNKKVRVGNVTAHPFRQRDIEAGETIYGTHPARQASVVASSAYNALEEINKLKNTLDPTSRSYQGNLPQSSSGPLNTASVALPTVNVETFNTGSYTNPQRTTDSSANDNSSSIDTYSFLDDAQRVADWKERNPDKNVFGFNKRNATSLQNRIDKAKEQGKDAKVGRLEQKLENFNNYQDKRKKRRDRHKKARSAQDATFLDKINPQNWAW